MVRSWKRAHTAVRDIRPGRVRASHLAYPLSGASPHNPAVGIPSGLAFCPGPESTLGPPGEIRRAACPLSGLAPRAGGWRQRKSQHVGTSPRDTVAAGVACPLYPHEKAGGGLSLLSTFSQVISRIWRAAGTSLPLAFIVGLPLRVATGIAPISRWRLATLSSAPGRMTAPAEPPRAVSSRSEGTLPWRALRPPRAKVLEALAFRLPRVDLP